ncbi:MAG: glycosyl transferase family 1 [Flavobacteriales bacterium]|nr:MAG: glycosyl transferase family 1 [Flavobacteriales bacterium]
MKILLVEPYFTGSHKTWAQGYQKYSAHDIEILSLSGHYWKWRMHGGAVTLAEKFLKRNLKPDLILVSDMLDLTTFQSLTREKTHHIPFAIYFHENQLCYPWSPTDRDVLHKRDNHYSFINYASALAADNVFFNSQYHLGSFFKELPKFLKGFPDNNELKTVEQIKAKSAVLNLGMDLKKFDNYRPEAAFFNSAEYKKSRATLLWNHRWEYDKNPAGFFDALYELDKRGVDFRLVILGENFEQQPEEFEKARDYFGEKVLHYGYCESFETYAQWLWKADILPVTSNHDFFGGSVVEAMYCDVKPLLPKRLAYPEHIPQQFHETFFYDDDPDLVNRLQRLIFNVGIIRKQKTGHFVERYHWSKMAEVYDRAMEKVTR